MNKIERLAATINAMAPGERLPLSRAQLDDLPSGGSILDPTPGWECVKAKVVGSDHPDLWEFLENPMNGNITVCRFKG